MRQFDFTPYRRSTVGFDRLFDMLESSARGSSGDNYPPFNLERVVSGKKSDSNDNSPAQMLHLGIANRSFERRFELADFIRVKAADLADGLLAIELVREVPEAMKPKKIAIGSIAPTDTAIDHKAVDAA